MSAVARSSRIELAAGPALIFAGLLAWWVSDRLIVIGPFDRAQVGWAVVVPLLALGAGALGLPARQPDRIAAARRVAIAVAAAVGLWIGFVVLTTTTASGCRPVTSPLDVLPQAVIASVLAAAPFIGASMVAAGRAARGSPIAAIITGAAAFLGIASIGIGIFFVALFPPLSCAAPH